MTDKQSFQDLFDLLQHQVDQARSIQNTIKRLNNAKKDAEITSQRQVLIKDLKTFTEELNPLQKKTQNVQQELEKALEEQEDAQGVGAGSSSYSTPRDQHCFPAPEDQENAYHLKARMMPHYYSKNKVLEAELLIKNRRNELRAQRQHRQINYNRGTNLSAVTTLRAIQMYEKKAKAEEARANALQAEVDELRAANEDKPKAKSADQNSGQSLLGSNRVNDVIRKNEHLLCVIKDQNLEIQRLRRDNNDLIKKTKHAEQDKHQVKSQLSTSDKAKRDLYVRYQKQKTQHDRLTRSLTRQSADWIEARKQQDQAEEEIRWRNVSHAALHGSYNRTHTHPTQKNVDQPRYMYPVENYAQPVATS